MGYVFQLAARDLLYAPSHRQQSIITTFNTLSSTGLNEKQHKRSTMRYRSDNQSNQEQMLYQSNSTKNLVILVTVTDKYFF